MALKQKLRLFIMVMIVKSGSVIQQRIAEAEKLGFEKIFISSFNLKGIDMIFAIASKFPDATFYIVGGSSIKTAAPANVKLLQNMPNDQIQPLLSKMQFYLQLSLSEGFPNALSEGMLCECVPIVSAVGGMPDIVNDCGYILKHKDENELYALINEALNKTDVSTLGKKARKRIEENYTFEKRKNKLLSELQKLE